ncbi:MAG: hypothetical protein M1814_003745 [Vezdaea aestivalis]|nr:MAG: hypothetical protein M1814_003745 [Vezdaea aestivalis]
MNDAGFRRYGTHEPLLVHDDTQVINELLPELNFHVMKFHFRRTQTSRNASVAIQKQTGQRSAVATPLLVPTLEEAYSALLKPIKASQLCVKLPEFVDIVNLMEWVVEETDYRNKGLGLQRWTAKHLWQRFQDRRNLDKDLYWALYGNLVIG